jgi:hypothetical protein
MPVTVPVRAEQKHINIDSLGWKTAKFVFWLCVSVLMVVATFILVVTLISESGI